MKIARIIVFILLLVLIIPIYAHPQSRVSTEFAVTQPFPSITCSYSGQPVPQSPDPLVSYYWDSPDPFAGMEVYSLSPISLAVDEPSGALWNQDEIFPVKVTRPCRLMFDFGQNNAGWLEFDSDDPIDEVRMSLSEYNEPAVYAESFIPGEYTVKTAVPEKYGNTYRLEFTADPDELYEGVRFGFIHFDRVSSPVSIKNVRLVCQVKPLNYEGSFFCSDTMLNRMWYTGAYTVKTNLLKDYIGAILVNRGDRISWTGDAYISQAVSMLVFGNYEFVRKNLERTAYVNNDIPGYSLLWVLSLVDYYYYTGDRSIVEKYMDNACRILDEAYAYFGVNRVLNFNGWDERLGAGFENPQLTEGQNYYKMLSIRAWLGYSRMIRELGNNEISAKYRDYAEKKIIELREDSSWCFSMGVHAAAEAVNAEFTDSRENEAIWLSAFGNRLQRVSFSPFNQYFIIQAMAGMGRFEEAMNTIDDCWGSQIRFGLTTFAEVFQPSWNDVLSPNEPPINGPSGTISLAHPWSAGITKWLSEEILGIKPSSGGFSTFSILPNLPTGLNFVKGEVPTPQGKIYVSIDLLNGKCSIVVPENTRAFVGIPKAGRKILKIRVNGKEVKDSGENGKYVFFADLEAGEYDFTIKYHGNPENPSVEELSYPFSKEPKEDRVTGGDWKGKYGQKGYILFNYDESGHRLKLPDFVQEIHYKRRGNVDETYHGNINLAENTADSRALASDRNNEETRNIGAIFTRDPIACYQTFPIDIRCRTEDPYQLAIYLVDWDRSGRRSAIEIFDLESLNVLAPVHIVRNYEEGKYVVYNLQGSVRIRINQVWGKNAMISGIFFD